MIDPNLGVMRSYRLGRLVVPVEVDLSLLLALPVFAWVVGGQVGRWARLLERLAGVDLAVGALTAGVTPWLLGLLAALGLFGSVLLHELGHTLVALRYGYEVSSIRLWVFGGVARMVAVPESPREELAIALAGPVVSVALGAAVAPLVAPAATLAPVAGFLAGYLALMNVSLAVFNMLPAFPMDGGRALRALLARRRSFLDATETAARVGKALAGVLAVVGLLSLNLLLVGLAPFLYLGARSGVQRARLRAAFEGLRVGDLMRSVEDRPAVGGLLGGLFGRSLATDEARIADEPAPRTPLGTLDRLFAADDGRRRRRLRALAAQERSVRAGDDPANALLYMQEGGVDRLPVVDDGDRVVGEVRRTDLLGELASTPEGRSLVRR